MSDNEIIKALKVCSVEKARCNGCPYDVNGCISENGTNILMKDILDLINRQKAEIERLQNEIGSLNKAYPCTVKMNDYCLVYARSLDDYDNLIGDISAEGIKEFAERLEYFVLNEDPEINELKCKDYESYMGGCNQFRLQIVKGINNILKK